MTPLAASGIGDALAQVAEALRTPVLVLALLALLLCALELGRFAMELWARIRPGRVPLATLVKQAAAEPARAATLARLAPSGFAASAVVELARVTLSGDPDGAEQALVAYELAVQRRLDRTRILVRAGPALGLMGTLIPLAPGLAALGRGEVATLASDLRTAFAATVVGLLVGTVAYGLTLTRTRMYTEDLASLERVVPVQSPVPAQVQSQVPGQVPVRGS